jgi:hypothetical protein
MFQLQMAAAPMGIVQPQNLYATVLEMAKAASFATPERFVTDPATIPKGPPQPPLPLVIEQMKAQTGMQEAQMDNQLKAQTAQLTAQTQERLEEMRLAHEKWKVEYQSQVDMAIERMKLSEGRDIEMTKLGSTERIKAAEFERDDDDMAERKAIEALMQQVEALKQGIMQVVQKVDGTKVVGVEKVRDPKTGRMVAGRVKRADGSIEEITLQ